MNDRHIYKSATTAPDAVRDVLTALFTQELLVRSPSAKVVGMKTDIHQHMCTRSDREMALVVDLALGVKRNRGREHAASFLGAYGANFRLIVRVLSEPNCLRAAPTLGQGV